MNSVNQLLVAIQQPEVTEQATLSPMIISRLQRYYEQGNFEQCQQNIIEYIDSENNYNGYLILLYSAAALVICSTVEALYESIESMCELFQLLACVPDRKLQSNSALILSNIDQILLSLIKQDGSLQETNENNIDIDLLKNRFSQLVKYLSDLSDNKWSQDKLVSQCQSHLQQLQNNFSQTKHINEEDTQLVDNRPDTNDAIHKSQSDRCSQQSVERFASEHWYLLIKKIALLKKLVADNRHFEAAIVYQDLEEILKNFDPKKYFPGLFFELFKTVAPHLPEVYRFIKQHSQSLEWYIGEKLYQTDLDRFITDIDSFIANYQSDEEFIEHLPPEHSTTNIDRGILSDEAPLETSETINFVTTSKNARGTNESEIFEANQKLQQYQNSLINEVDQIVENDFHHQNSQDNRKPTT